MIILDPRTGQPEPGEQPADIVNGLVHGVGPETTLAEFDWIDGPLAEEGLAALLDAATYALGENQIE